MASDDHGVERFVGDNRPLTSSDAMVSRMMNPTVALNKLADEGSGRFDLLVDSAKDINFVHDPSSETGVSIAPNLGDLADESENGGRFNAAISRRGSVPVSTAAMNQICTLLGVKGGWKRYEKMSGPVSNFLRDMNAMFGTSTGEASFVARTNSKGDSYEVEAFFAPDTDRTDPTVVVGGAMRSIIERFGDNIRGVELLRHSAGGGDSYRILFGDPVMQEGTADPTKRLYTMLDITMSHSRRFNPSASLGLWRLWCLNGCTTRDWDLASFKGDSTTTGDQLIGAIEGLVDIAFPLASAIGSRLQALETTPLEMRAKDVISGIHGRGLIGNALRDSLERSMEFGGGDGKYDTEWDMFNLFTDVAKGSGTLHSRASNENKALQFGMADGSFSGVAAHGFNRSQFKDSMDELYRSNVGDPKTTGLNGHRALSA